MNSEAKKWLKSATDKIDKRLKESAVYAGLVSKDFLQDPECALQLGLSIFYDKPIILIVDKDLELPKNLVKIATLVTRIDFKVEGEIQKASDLILEELKRIYPR